MQSGSRTCPLPLVTRASHVVTSLQLWLTSEITRTGRAVSVRAGLGRAALARRITTPKAETSLDALRDHPTIFLEHRFAKWLEPTGCFQSEGRFAQGRAVVALLGSGNGIVVRDAKRSQRLDDWKQGGSQLGQRVLHRDRPSCEHASFDEPRAFEMPQRLAQDLL